MAITFPASPTNGQVYQDPTSGRQFIFNSSVPGWQLYENLKFGYLNYPGKSFFDSMQWTFNNTSTNGWYVRGGGTWEMGDPTGALLSLQGRTQFVLSVEGIGGSNQSFFTGTPTGGLTWQTPAGTYNVLTAPSLVTTTPTATAGAGAFTTVSAEVDRQVINNTNFQRVWVQVNITNNGTAASFVVVPLGVTVTKESVLVGRAAAVSGKSLQGTVAAGSSNLIIINYDNTYPGATGERLTLEGDLYV